MRRAVVLIAGLVLVVVGWPAAASADATETVEGEIQRLAVDLVDGGGLELAFLVPDEGEPLRVRSDDVADVETGSVVAADVVPDEQAAQDVVAEDGGVTVTDVDVLAAPEESAADADDLAAAGLSALSAGSRPVGVVTATFSGQSAPGVTPAALASDITGYVSPYWSESTGGAISFTVSAQVAMSAGSLGALPSSCTTSVIFGVLDASAQAAGVYPTVNRQRHSVVYTPRVPACGFAGVAYVADGGSAWINGTNDRWPTIAHELGHTLTLGHSDSRVQCSGGQDGAYERCHHGEYGDAYDVMGANGPAGSAGLLSGAQLDMLGLVPSGSMTVLTSSAQVTLQSVGGRTGLRFVAVPVGDVTYHVEYRGRVGRDTDLGGVRYGCPLGVPGGCTSVPYQPGVVVRRVDAGLSQTFLLDADRSSGWFAMDPGETFTSADMSVNVRVVSASSSSAVVAIDIVDTTPQTPFAQLIASPDMTGNRLGDLFAVDTAGRLFLYGGIGGGRVALAAVFGTGWDEMRVFAPGDWNGDGRSDLVAADPKGDLWLYPGNGAGGFGAKSKIGNGWNGYRIVPAGDMNGDRAADLLAIDPEQRLWLYPGDGRGSFGRRVQVGNGWEGFELYAAGDANRDGRRDILSIDAAGRLWYYAGRGGGFFWMRQQVGHGWTGYAFASGADLNADGYSDLVGRDPSGRLWFYPGRYGGTFGMKTQIGNGW